MAHIRAVMVTTPAMWSDLIARVAPERIDLEVVAELRTRDALAQILQLLCPDLVVIGLRPKEPDAVVCAMFERLPGTKFITLSADGRAIVGHEQRTHNVELTHAAPEALIGFLCGVLDKEA